MSPWAARRSQSAPHMHVLVCICSNVEAVGSSAAEASQLLMVIVCARGPRGGGGVRPPPPAGDAELFSKTLSKKAGIDRSPRPSTNHECRSLTGLKIRSVSPGIPPTPCPTIHSVQHWALCNDSPGPYTGHKALHTCTSWCACAAMWRQLDLLQPKPHSCSWSLCVRGVQEGGGVSDPPPPPQEMPSCSAKL